MKKKLWIAAVLALSSTGAMAQSIYSSEKDFVGKASAANQFEIDASKMALKISKNDKIRAFATQMIADHTAAERSLRQAVHIQGATMGPDAPHMSVMDNLKATAKSDSDADFNRAYIDAQAKSYSDDVALLDQYKANGKDKALLAWTDKTLPVVRRNNAEVVKLNSQSAWYL